MNRIYRRESAVLFALLFAVLVGCGKGESPQTLPSPQKEADVQEEAGTAGQDVAEGAVQGAEEQKTENSDEEQAETGGNSWTVQGSGSISAGDTLSGAAVLTAEQQEPVLAFMDAYYQSMAYLQLQDLSGLFTEDEEHARFRAQVDGTSWTAVTDNRTQEEMHRAVFEMILGIRQASELDLRLLSYDYELEVQNIEEQADGCVQIEAVEYADMRFSHTPDTDSQVTGVWHSFVIKETDGQWRLTHHAAYDSAYFSFIRWENSATGRSTGGTSAGEFAAMAEERIQNAREQIESREAAADGRTGAAAADHAYDREAAAAYAREWAGERNPQWGVYDGAGGNCMNYVSQCLYASGIPMDQSGDAQWYWYSDSSRAPAWTGVDSFRDYVMNNSGYGLCAQTDVPWNSGDIGDVILMSTAGNYHHAVIITQVVQDESSGTVD